MKEFILRNNKIKKMYSFVLTFSVSCCILIEEVQIHEHEQQKGGE